MIRLQLCYNLHRSDRFLATADANRELLHQKSEPNHPPRLPITRDLSRCAREGVRGRSGIVRIHQRVGEGGGMLTVGILDLRQRVAAVAGGEGGGGNKKRGREGGSRGLDRRGNEGKENLLVVGRAQSG